VKHNLLLGNSKGYSLGQIRNWLVSAIRHRGSYDIGLLLCDNDAEILDFCDAHGVYVYPHFDLAVSGQEYYFARCGLVSETLKKASTTYVLATDIRDVVFQRDPFPDFMQALNYKKGVLTSENILLRDEPWNIKVYKEIYGEESFDAVSDKEVINSGVVFGESMFLSEIFMMLQDAARMPNAWAEQPVLNHLYHQFSIIRDNFSLANADDRLVAHIGVSGPTNWWESWNFKKNLIRGRSEICDGIITDAHGEAFAIAHQYDRVDEWRQQVDAIYA
jgi:hypothetical protein